MHVSYPEKFKDIPGPSLFYTLCSILDPILYRPISACERLLEKGSDLNSLIFSSGRQMSDYMFIGSSDRTAQ